MLSERWIRSWEITVATKNPNPKSQCFLGHPVDKYIFIDIFFSNKEHAHRSTWLVCNQKYLWKINESYLYRTSNFQTSKWPNCLFNNFCWLWQWKWQTLSKFLTQFLLLVIQLCLYCTPQHDETFVLLGSSSSNVCQ